MNSTGVFPDSALRAACDQGWLSASTPILADQFQPASLDLRLGPVAYRTRASFLPGRGRTVAERLPEVTMHAVDLRAGAVLERDCVYVAPLLEHARLPADVSASANPKSSTGRVDVFTRLVADQSTAFDRVPAGYAGPLFAEISPRTFSVLAREGERLSQLRLRRADDVVTDEELRRRQDDPSSAIVQGVGDIEGGLLLSVDLVGEGGPIGYRARRHAGVIDLAGVGAHDPREFWEPIGARADRALILDPGEFYILASREWVRIPPDLAAEMAPFVAEMGEFRVHYAGFFDPGFGCAETGGSGGRAVLEVRSRDVPFVLEHGQPVARLIYEPLCAAPHRLYGAAGSHYQAQGLKLSKHFQDWR